MKLLQELQELTEKKNQVKMQFYGITADCKDKTCPPVGLSVYATSRSEAIRKAKQRLSKNYTITSIEDGSEIDKLLTKLKKQAYEYIEDHAMLKAAPSLAKGYQRKIDRVETLHDYDKLEKLMKRDLRPLINK